MLCISLLTRYFAWLAAGLDTLDKVGNCWPCRVPSSPHLGAQEAPVPFALLEGGHRMVRLCSFQGRRQCYESLTIYLFCLVLSLLNVFCAFFYRQHKTMKQSKQ